MRTYSQRDLILTLDRWVKEKDLKEGKRIVTIEYLILALCRMGKVKDIMGGMRIVTIDYLILTLSRYFIINKVSYAG